MATLSSPTLNRLIKSVRTALNQPKKENSFWSDEELTEYLNDAVRVYFLEVSERAEGQFDTVTDLNITSGTETVALPSDFFEVKALYRKTGTTYVPLNYNVNVTDAYSTEGTGGAGYFPSYYLRGNDIVLRDVPGITETAGLKLEYTAFPETMIWGGDTLTSKVSPIFKELIVAYGIYKAKLKESMVKGGDLHVNAANHLNKLYEIFKETVGQRSKYPQFVKPWSP